MQVWRLENKIGKGIYRADGVNGRKAYCCSPKHPAPFDDTLLNRNAQKMGFNTIYSILDSLTGHLFAFDSPMQLLNWFYNDDFLIKSEKAGIVISIYEAENVIKGYTQVCFPREFQNQKYLVKQYTPTEFLKEFSCEKSIEREENALQQELDES